MRIILLFWFLLSFVGFQAQSQSFTIKSTDASAFPVIRSTVQVPAGTSPKSSEFKVVEEGKELNFDFSQAPDSASDTGKNKAIFLLMEASGFTYGTALNNFKQATIEALSGLRTGDKVNVAYFGKANKSNKALNMLSAEFTSDITTLKNEITSKVTTSRDTTYAADVYKAIYEALDYMAEKQNLPQNKQLIVLSAAINNSRSPIKADDCIEKSQRLKIPVYTITYKTGNRYAPDNFVRLSDRTNGETTLAKTLSEIRTASRDFISLPPTKPASSGDYVLAFTTSNPKNGRMFQYEVRYKGQRQAATYKAPEAEKGFLSGYGVYVVPIILVLAGGMGWLVYQARQKKVADESSKIPEQEARFREAEIKERQAQPEVKPVSKPINQAPPKDLKRTMVAGGIATPAIQVTAGTFAQNFALDRPLLSIGRAAGNDIVIPEATVSGKHATITQEGGQFYITDLGSTNGTFIHTTRIQGKHLLKPGDTIRMGTAQAKFVV
ncbi:FHA domain-containing protein [Rhodocytophaga aerolata]|uniref:FHA domain-containing protein n=1 Tax=Rhodocytophaga aerolata TaxID=455078 RepID=A0ABT8R4D1_9BACT|nr:FHA domain-containing protein [Rhodocytophaga aerolata]MDO1446954.1 FHA domain-containing protein [Rhodocytophaga aerolata]